MTLAETIQMIRQAAAYHLGSILATYRQLRWLRQSWTVQIGTRVKSQLRIPEEEQEVVGGAFLKPTKPS